VKEIEVCIVSPGTQIEGKLEVHETLRFHGRLKGSLHGTQGSQLTLAEDSLVEGDVRADTLFIEGFVEGDVRAERVVIRGNARLRGKLSSPHLLIEPGAVVEAEIRRVSAAT
jgi:cytoskeletal protein CcmA (bactofilin family)